MHILKQTMYHLVEYYNSTMKNKYESIAYTFTMIDEMNENDIEMHFREFVDYMYIQYYQCDIELYFQICHLLYNQYIHYDNNEYSLLSTLIDDFNEISIKIMDFNHEKNHEFKQRISDYLKR